MLDLSPLDPADGEGEHYRFVGRSQPQPHGRVYGGQVLAQALMAAGRSVPERPGRPLDARLLPAAG